MNSVMQEFLFFKEQDCSMLWGSKRSAENTTEAEVQD